MCTALEAAKSAARSKAAKKNAQRKAKKAAEDAAAVNGISNGIAAVRCVAYGMFFLVEPVFLQLQSAIDIMMLRYALLQNSGVQNSASHYTFGVSRITICMDNCSSTSTKDCRNSGGPQLLCWTQTGALRGPWNGGRLRISSLLSTTGGCSCRRAAIAGSYGQPNVSC